MTQFKSKLHDGEYCKKNHPSPRQHPFQCDFSAFPPKIGLFVLLLESGFTYDLALASKMQQQFQVKTSTLHIFTASLGILPNHNVNMHTDVLTWSTDKSYQLTTSQTRQPPDDPAAD
jgi:hypothetical protein